MVRTCTFTLYNISNSSKYKIIFYQKKKSSPFLGRNMSFNLITPEIANKCSKKKRLTKRNNIRTSIQYFKDQITRKNII